MAATTAKADLGNAIPDAPVGLLAVLRSMADPVQDLY
jgi:hypothetical protein